MFGQTGGNIVENGLTIRCTVLVYSSGAMAECILGSITMIRRVARVYLNGTFVNNTKFLFRPDGRKYVGLWLDGK